MPDKTITCCTIMAFQGIPNFKYSFNTTRVLCTLSPNKVNLYYATLVCDDDWKSAYKSTQKMCLLGLKGAYKWNPPEVPIFSIICLRYFTPWCLIILFWLLVASHCQASMVITERRSHNSPRQVCSYPTVPVPGMQLPHQPNHLAGWVRCVAGG